MSFNIFTFVPAFWQTISATTFLTTHALQGHFAHKGIGHGISTLSFPDIAELRAMAMTIWYDTMPAMSHLLFIDADMGFPPEMVTDMMLFDEPIVGTIYPQRRLPLSWAGSGTGTPTTERRGNFMKVEGVGMGCTLIRRDVVTKMLEQMPGIVDTRLHLHPAGQTMREAGSTRLIRAFEKMDIPDRGLVSEDLSFCIRAAQCGMPTWAAIGYKISHVGPFDYSGRYLDQVEAQMAQAAQQTTQPADLAPSAGGTTLTESLVVSGMDIVTGPACDNAVTDPQIVEAMPAAKGHIAAHISEVMPSVVGAVMPSIEDLGETTGKRRSRRNGPTEAAAE